MNRRERIIILACVAVIIGFFIYKQSLNLYHGANELHRPNHETRQIGHMRVNRWMTVKEVAARYHVTVKQVFQVLNIKPARGDENLPMKQLEDKYNLSKEEIKKALDSLNVPSSRREVNSHD